jgi:iron-sulfur cluster assembly protein
MMMSTESTASRPNPMPLPAAETSAEEAPKKKLGITCSPKAVEAMRAQLEKRGTPGSAIRVGIRGGGCSGFSYVIEFDDAAPRSGDLVLEYAEDGKSTVHVHCDKKSLIYLAGTVLDWEKSLMYQGFKFRNPQEASSCGCGHSFTVA